MKKIGLGFLFILMSLSLFSSPTSAHTNNSEGFSNIKVNGKMLNYQLELDLVELGHAMNLHLEKSESQNWDYLNQVLYNNKSKIQDYINSRLKIYADGSPLEGKLNQINVKEVKNRPFSVLDLTYSMNGKPENLLIDYNIFSDDSDPSHANFTTVKMDKKQEEFLFTYEVREQKIGEVTFLHKTKQFLVLGIKHIFTGYDHILFVISLIIGAKTIKQIFTLATAFTIAHSVTLVLATLKIVNLPTNIVKSGIALSIIYVALQNIFNKDSKKHPLIAFGFGLIHGFGFAGLLSEMRLESGGLATSLLFFNIGIEIGQIIIISIMFPLLIYIKKRQYTKWLIPGTSVGVLMFGLLWFFQRAFFNISISIFILLTVIHFHKKF